MWRWLVVFALALSGCSEQVPECSVGELRYVGRPARQLFDYETACRADCFSPSTVKSCEQDCGSVDVARPAGALLDSDRLLAIVDPSTIGGDRALVHTFGYQDETGGSAPTGWSFVAAGPSTYESNVVVGSARFLIQTFVGEIAWESTEAGEVPVVTRLLGEPLDAVPGRIEVERIDSRLKGQFYLLYETPKRQPQGQVVGCFDLTVSDAVSTPAGAVRVLSP